MPSKRPHEVRNTREDCFAMMNAIALGDTARAKALSSIMRKNGIASSTRQREINLWVQINNDRYPAVARWVKETRAQQQTAAERRDAAQPRAGRVRFSVADAIAATMPRKWWQEL